MITYILLKRVSNSRCQRLSNFCSSSTNNINYITCLKIKCICIATERLLSIQKYHYYLLCKAPSPLKFRQQDKRHYQYPFHLCMQQGAYAGPSASRFCHRIVPALSYFINAAPEYLNLESRILQDCHRYQLLPCML